MSFKIADGTEAGDLVIENERLKSTLMILNQKLKVTQDLDTQIDGLNAENKVLREDHAEALSKARENHEQEIENMLTKQKKAQTEYN